MTANRATTARRPSADSGPAHPRPSNPPVLRSLVEDARELAKVKGNVHTGAAGVLDVLGLPGFWSVVLWRVGNALHDHGNFSRAAESCFVTQSTLSAGIRELEESLGVDVAERTKRSVVITPAGRRLVARARLLLRDAEALAAMSKDDAGPMSGVLEMGVLPTIGPFLLPQLVRRLGALFPRLRLALREDKTRHHWINWQRGAWTWS